MVNHLCSPCRRSHYTQRRKCIMAAFRTWVNSGVACKPRRGGGGVSVPCVSRSNRSNRTQASYNAAENGGYGEGAKFGTIALSPILSQISPLLERHFKNFRNSGFPRIRVNRLSPRVSKYRSQNLAYPDVSIPPPEIWKYGKPEFWLSSQQAVGAWTSRTLIFQPNGIESNNGRV